jgi:quercetin dioxygenase-like cupin family protein
VNYTFISDLAAEVQVPEKGILSRVLRKDEYVNITLFAFSAGEELSAHSAATPAAIHFVEGNAMVSLAEDTVQATAGSFIYMPPMLSHGIVAITAVKMLLIQVRNSGVARNL